MERDSVREQQETVTKRQWDRYEKGRRKKKKREKNRNRDSSERDGVRKKTK